MPAASARQGLFPAWLRTAACLAAGLGLLTIATVAAAETVPVPRISPLKADPDTPEPESRYFDEDDNLVYDPLQEPVDTALIPPSGPDGAAVDFSLLNRFDPAAAANQPLALAPLAAPANPFEGPLDLTSSAAAAGGPIDLAPVSGGKDDPIVLGSVTIDARLVEDGPTIPSGVMWRVFDTRPGDDGKLRLVGQAEGGPVTLKLRTGEYIVHAAYGRAGYSRKVMVSEVPSEETLVLNAGGIRLAALVGGDRPLTASDVRFDIYASDEAGPAERILMMENAPPSKTISLNAGIYHVICRYGDANAVVRADIKVEPGKLTEAALYQNAARLTLKLVADHGGEALANTSWSVVTPAGESVVESVGAFPSVVLAAGEYTAIAKNGDRIFERTFTVEAGLNRDVEVLAR